LVRDDAILIAGLRQPDWLGRSVEEVHGGRATELERRPANGSLKALQPLGHLDFSNAEQNLDGRSKIFVGEFLQTPDFHEEKLLRKADVLLQQAVTSEASVRIRKNRFTRRKSKWGHGLGRYCHGFGRSFRFANDDLHNRCQEQFVKQAGNRYVSAKVEREARQGQFVKGQTLSAN
jgi:hypothetical protein